MIDLTGHFAEYRLLGLLGQGSNGVVYRARWLPAPGESSVVAIKILRPAPGREDALAEGLTQAVRAMQDAPHPGIIEILTDGAAALPGSEVRAPFLVMPYFVAGSLQQHLEKLVRQQQMMPLDVVLKLTVAIAETLGYAQQRGLVHGYLKPANILLSGRLPNELGLEPSQPIIADFGIARLGHDPEATQEIGLGSLPYAAPEQIMGEPTDGRSDLYALGIILYQMVTGRLPYLINALADVQQHLDGRPTQPSTLRPDLPSEINNIILRAMARRSAERHQTGVELADALRAVLGSLLDGATAATGADAPEPPEELSQTLLETPEWIRDVAVAQRFPLHKTWDYGDFRLAITHQLEGTFYRKLEKPLLRLGRSAACEICLDDRHISGEHVRLMRVTEAVDGRWRIQWQVEDQGSVNGSFLNGDRLPAYTPLPWPEGETLRIGPYFLQWQAASLAASQELAVMAIAATQADGSAASPVEVKLTPETLTLDPGSEGLVTVELLNNSAQVEHYQLRLRHDLPRQCQVIEPAATLNLGAAQDGQAAISIKLPAGDQANQAAAGEYLCQVQVASERTGQVLTAVTIPITITPFEGFVTDLHPTQFANRGTTQLTITNVGNTRQYYRLGARDDGNELRYAFYPNQTMVPVNPGRAEAIKIAVQAKKRPWLRPRPIKFHVEIRTNDLDKPDDQQATVIVPPRIPVWLPPLLLILAVLGFFLYQWFSQQLIVRAEESTAVLTEAQATTTALYAKLQISEGPERETLLAEITKQVSVVNIAAETATKAFSNVAATATQVIDELTAVALSATPTPTLTPTPANFPPTGITLSNRSVLENEPPSIVVGLLATQDPDPTDSHSYNLEACKDGNEADKESFDIDRDALVTVKTLDFEKQSSYCLAITSTEYRDPETETGSDTIELQSITAEFRIAVQNVEDTPILSLIPATMAVSEGQTAVLSLKVDPPGTQPITVTYSTRAGTATLDDFVPVPDAQKTIKLGPGQASISLPPIAVISDTVSGEVNEIFTVELTNPQNAKLGANSTATVTIIDASGLPKVRFADQGNPLTVSEGDPASIHVVLEGSSAETVSVGYTTYTAVGNATPGVDYNSVSGILTWGSGSSNPSRTITITTIADNLALEGDENFAVALTLPQNAVIVGSEQKNIVIEDLDEIPLITWGPITPTAITRPETFNSMALPVVLSQPAAQEIRVGVVTANTDTASRDIDYRLYPLELIWPPGTLGTKYVTLDILPDFIDEGDSETFTIGLAALDPDITVTTTIISVTIQDNDTQGMQILPSALAISEAPGLNKGDFTVRLLSEPTANVSVELTKAPGDCPISLPDNADPFAFTLTAGAFGTWYQGEQISVYALNDPDSANATCTLTAVANGGDYNTITQTLPITIQDDDPLAITLEPVQMNFSQNSAPPLTRNLELNIESQPTAVTLNLAVRDASCGLTLSNNQVVIDSNNVSGNTNVSIAITNTVGVCGQIFVQSVIEADTYTHFTANEVLVQVVAANAAIPNGLARRFSPTILAFAGVLSLTTLPIRRCFRLKSCLSRAIKKGMGHENR